MIQRLKAAGLWIWSHRTKVIGTIGTGAGYAACHQDQLGLFLSTAAFGRAMFVIGALTFSIGMYNTFSRAP